MKVHKIEIENFKAISEEEATFNGCSAIITGGNNKGKSSLLKGLIERFQGIKTENKVKIGEQKGSNIVEFTDGSKITWNFTNEREKFEYLTSDSLRMNTGVLKLLSLKLFGSNFDIDKFIKSSQTEQNKTVQNLLGLDIDKLDDEYKVLFSSRTIWNRELRVLENKGVHLPKKVDKLDILPSDIFDELKLIKTKNEDKQSKWLIENEKFQKETELFNDAQVLLRTNYSSLKATIDKLKTFEHGDVGKFINYDGLYDMLNNLTKAEPSKPFTYIGKPELESTDALDLKLKETYLAASIYESYSIELKTYKDHFKKVVTAKEEIEKLNNNLDSIKKEKLRILKEAKLPIEFELTENGLLYNGLFLNNSSLSSSSKYIAALKLGHLALGELRTMHFDASFLDNNSLSEIQDWASKNNLQLLIERPDLDGGDIKYEITEISNNK